MSHRRVTTAAQKAAELAELRDFYVTTKVDLRDRPGRAPRTAPDRAVREAAERCTDLARQLEAAHADLLVAAVQATQPGSQTGT